MKVLIRGGHIMDPENGRDGIYDLLMEHGKIVRVEKDISEEADEVIDAEGLDVMPGFIDLHVHFREPGFEYKETIRSGSMAAARGGFTSVCPMPNTRPVIDSPTMVRWLVQKCEEDSLVHILPVGAVSKGQMGEEIANISGMKEAGIYAISEDGKSMMHAGFYEEAMRQAKEAGVVVLAHCEDKNMVGKGVLNAGSKAKELSLPGITNAVEDVIAARDLILAKETGARLHLCHCSTKDSVSLLKWAKDAGADVSGEVCPHHFTLTEEDILSDDANYKMNPPLRSREDKDALRAGISSGTIGVIATDHAPHSEEEKKKSIADAPFGIVGLETAYALARTELVETGLLTPMDLVDRMSREPARILGIPKGTLAPGAAADVTIADPALAYRIDPASFASKGKNTPFAGRHVKGKIVMTFVDGQAVYDGRQNL